MHCLHLINQITHALSIATLTYICKYFAYFFHRPDRSVTAVRLLSTAKQAIISQVGSYPSKMSSAKYLHTIAAMQDIYEQTYM